jgi:hypothetical protein
MAELIPFNSAEADSKASWYSAFGAGLISGLIKVPEGIVSLGAELIDLGADTDTVASVERFFDDINPFEEIAEERTIGKLAEVFTQIGIPGTAGFKAGTKLARKALDAKKKGIYAKFGKESKRALEEVEKLNKKAGYRKFVTGIMGGATGEAFITDADKIGSFGDLFGGPTALDREETYGREEASRRLLNRVKFGSESLLVTPVIAGVGKGAKALAQRGKELAYSDSAFERWINKYVGAPFRPRGDLPEEIFAAEMTKQGLKARDTDAAKEIVNTITKEVDKVFPEMETIFNKSTKQEKDKFLDLLNKTLFEGDISKPINPKSMDDIVKQMDDIELDPQSRQKIVGAIDKARSEFTTLVGYLDNNIKDKKNLKPGLEELQELLKGRIQGWVGSTYRAFEPRSRFFKAFQRYKPTDEAYSKTINLFRRYLAKTDTSKNVKLIKDEFKQFVPEGTEYYQQAKYMVDDILEKGQQARKKPGQLPDLNYTDKTAQGVKTKSFEEMLKKTGGKGSKVIRELFGEIKDPRYSIFNAMTNLSSAARTSSFFENIAENNRKLQAAGERGAFWTDEALARQGVRSNETGIQVVKVGDYLKENKLPGIQYVDNEILDSWTSKEIAEGMLHANDVPRGLAGAIRGREAASSAESAATYLYRTLLLAPKAASQMAKTILSIPTHLRNLISAGMFTVANGTIAEPTFFKNAVKGFKGSGVFKLGPKSPEMQKLYQELLELGVVNSQVQIGDLTALFKDVIQSGDQFVSPDTILKSFFKKMKKVGSFLQGKYVAEDDAFKITNFLTELERLKIGRAKQLNIKRADLDATLDDAVELELKQKAADIVKNTVPNYAYVGSAVKTSRVLPIGNFMSFPSEMIRTTAGIGKQALSELRHSRPTRGSNIGPMVFDIEANAFVKNDNPMYATGMKRIAGMTTALTAVPIGLTEGMKALYDVTEDEMSALRQFVPEWSKNSTLLPMRDDDGTLRYIDFSHSNVYDVIGRPFRTLLNNVLRAQESDDVLLRGFRDGIIEASGEIMNPFISESIWTEAMTDIVVRNGRTNEGRLLYTDETPFGDKLSIQFLHLGEALAPSYKQYQRIGQAAFGTPTKRGDELEIGPELGGLMGFRAIKIDPLESMGFKIAEYQTGIRNARREFTGGYFGLLRGGPIKANDIIERFFVSNQARFNVQKEMYRNLNSANILGVEDNALRRTFKERQLSDDSFRQLKDGRFDPYFPSKDIEDRFKEIARDLGDIDVFKEVKPILREMNRDLKSLDLEETFDLDLTDYLEEGPGIAESLGLGNIGQPPMPNQQILQTSQVQAPGNITSQGLTPTELALLSPEEQQIRLRQRGLA